ncbi:beta-1,4-mannosyltransferase [Fomitiporia mediterranea MF3/22]|uniref:beta-1,4-mannosyltransferase n=1 Tax=Fomitiporia mediterranea (strain MF3/22) TaxID=694068 RepID=UPI0004407B7F|nr:beta-1,4-mannosyltransferase [Fomitiporia mediterranea MF3/22]EJD04443.1 beta-1,4-mannosyltransferase [Fomitiporia mediterranea MF3/22]
MYHAESFANAHFQTYLVGYSGSKPIPSLERLNVEFVHLAETPSLFKGLPFLLLAPIKIVVQVCTILNALLRAIPHPPEYIIVQNPPSIPTLALVQLVCKLRGSKLIIDWHNLGYSILALKLGEKHILVKIAKKFEKFFGRSAHIHLFVTKVMLDHLAKEWELQGTKTVLHDRPPSYFKRAEVFESHDLFNKLTPSLSSHTLTQFFPKYTSPRSTPFTQLSTQPHASFDPLTFDSELSNPSSPGSTFATLRADRPALVVSSTSWTPDEDFGLLLDALTEYEKCAREINSSADSKKKLPKLLAIVTGKGPQKEFYMNEVMRREREEGWRWVRCRSLWLEAEDYPILLGSADLGVCLHSSSSNLDLPMKVVDMFGCGLPVCALDFPCLSELVKSGQNGHTFRTSSELTNQLADLLLGFPDAQGLANLRASFTRSMTSSTGSSEYRHHEHHHSHHYQDREEEELGWCSWSENWNCVLKPLVLSDVEREETQMR